MEGGWGAGGFGQVTLGAEGVGAVAVLGSFPSRPASGKGKVGLFFLLLFKRYLLNPCCQPVMQWGDLHPRRDMKKGEQPAPIPIPRRDMEKGSSQPPAPSPEGTWRKESTKPPAPPVH